MRISVLAAAVLSTAILAVPAGAATNPKSKVAKAPQQTSAKTREQGWIARCSSASRGAAPDCAVNQRVVLARTGQLLAAVTIRVPSKTRKPVLMVQTPLGLYLPPGITLGFSKGKSVSVPLQTCDNNGCYAGQPLSHDMLKKFQAGGRLTLSFQNMTRQDIKLTVSLKGFDKAYGQAK